MGAGSVREVTATSFENEVLESDLPVFVDFWAEWCGPCRIIAPTIEALAKQYAGQMKFVKVNVDENEALANRFQIQGIPTLLIFQAGRLLERIVGGADKAYYTRVIDQVLSIAGHVH